MERVVEVEWRARRGVIPEESKLTVLVVDDDARFRGVVRGILEASGDVDIIGEAGDGEEGVEQCRRLHPDVVLMDIGMPGLNGLAATLLIKGELPQCKVVLLTVHEEERYRLAGDSCGADLFVPKRHLVSELVEGGVLSRLRPPSQ